MHIALIGLGIMGSGMAANWLDKGFDLTVYNRTRSKAQPFAARGAQVADSPRQAAAHADLVASMVGDDAQSRAVWLGDEGALAGARPGAILIECSTLTPDWVRELAALARDKGFEFLESPVTGSKPQAAAGQLTLFIGGEAATLDKVRPALEAISKKINFVGPSGAGATWKLINNMMCAVQLVALAEGLEMARQAGIDLELAATMVAESAAASPIVTGKLPRLTEQRYGDADFSLRWMHKDVRYALTVGVQLGVPLTTVQAAEPIFQQAEDKGLSDQDMASVAEGLRG